MTYSLSLNVSHPPRDTTWCNWDYIMTELEGRYAGVMRNEYRVAARCIATKYRHSEPESCQNVIKMQDVTPVNYTMIS